MPKQLKRTSGEIIISGLVAETVINTYQQDEIDLQLNVLDREVFVVTAVDIGVDRPDGIAGVDTIVQGCLSVTNRDSIGSIANSNVIASGVKAVMSLGYADAGVGFSTVSPETPTGSSLEYIAIISTNNFFAAVKGQGNNAIKNMVFRMWGYRATADAGTFAALSQSELLSA